MPLARAKITCHSALAEQGSSFFFTRARVWRLSRVRLSAFRVLSHAFRDPAAPLLIGPAASKEMSISSTLSFWRALSFTHSHERVRQMRRASPVHSLLLTVSAPRLRSHSIILPLLCCNNFAPPLTTNALSIYVAIFALIRLIYYMQSGRCLTGLIVLSFLCCLFAPRPDITK